MWAWGARRGRCVNGWRLAVRVAVQSSDGIQQLHAVPKRRDAKLLQVLVRQARENRLIYVILTECRLILPEAQAPQPDHNVHDGRPTIMVAHIIGWGSEGVQGGVGVLRASQSPLRSNALAGLYPFFEIPGWGSKS
jgi:hypothetical protein